MASTLFDLHAVDKKTLPPLPALRAFEAAARHMSFSRAGTELHVTAAAISHQIKLLERWLGVPLFARRPNGVVLTAAGSDYALRLRDVFDRLLLTSRALRDHQARPVVRIRCQFSVAAMWLTSRVATLARERPDLEIRLIAAEHRATGPLGADIAIYFPRSELPRHTQHLLFPGRFRAFAAPSLVGRGALPRPAEVATLPLLHLAVEEKGWTSPGFAEWFEEAGVEVASPLPGLRFNLAHLATQAATLGTGVALLPDNLCVDAQRQGLLVALPGPALPAPLPFMLMCRDTPEEPVAWVRDALLAAAASQTRLVE
ncbi:LysR family transcriptional regulator [Piscinibacterium candidicorallinum]|uniref:LysR family transcriptional regulator n=1 Tax=Piscinibacterium candidicorallinum TaxID=1793872 RepID=A0ABV7H300_9BURK